ncbi:MAG: tail fiber domain-containing protein [Chloroflexota bacterium]
MKKLTGLILLTFAVLLLASAEKVDAQITAYYSRYDTLSAASDSNSVIAWGGADTIDVRTGNVLRLRAHTTGVTIPGGQRFTAAYGDVDTLTVTTANIDGGTIDGANIGAGTPGTGAFTTFSASSTANISTATNWQLGSVAYTGTMANINTLRDDSMADALHRHSELSASDGTPNPAVSVDADGNVGIGTSTPKGHLELVAAAPFSGIKISGINSDAMDTVAYYDAAGTTAAQEWIQRGNVYPVINTHSNGTAGSYVLLQKSRTASGAKGFTVVQSGDQLGEIYFGGADGGEFLTAVQLVATVGTTPGNDDMPGTFSVYCNADGATSGTERLRVDYVGDTYTNDGTISSLSDSTLKRDIERFWGGLDVIKALRPVTFYYDGSVPMCPDDGVERIGFLAQEVASVAPYLTKKSIEHTYADSVKDGVAVRYVSQVDTVWALNQIKMIPILVNAIQELAIKDGQMQATIDSLRVRIVALEKR